MLKVFTKEELIDDILEISKRGWIKSVKRTKNVRNDGAVGNTLEKILGIRENNLPIANAGGWELKGQREHTSSLISLKHFDPYPRPILQEMLLPHYGWPHREAGKKYSKNEMSFRSTTCATQFTSRGFRIIVDRDQKKIRFTFDALKVGAADPEIAAWLKTVQTRIGLGPLNIEPYWGFDDLRNVVGEKVTNCFYVTAESKVERKREYFLYKHLLVLSGFSFNKFIECLEKGVVQVDFDARTHHNHGTKFRIRQGCWKEIYSSVTQIF